MSLRTKLSKKSLVAGGLAGATVVAATVLGAGTAAAEAETGIICSGTSPNIVDFPYRTRLYFSQYNDPSGVATFTLANASSVWGYTTAPTFHWTNLNTGAQGSITQARAVPTLFGVGAAVYFVDVPVGAGPVRIDLSIANTGLAPVPAVTCGGIVEIQ